MSIRKENELAPLSVEVEGETITVFQKDESNNLYAFPTELCRFVGYKNYRNKASDVFKKNEKILQKFEGILKIGTPSGIQEARILVNEGIHFFIMELKKPKAKLLKLAYAHIVEQYRRGELISAQETQLTEVNQAINGLLGAIQGLYGNQVSFAYEISLIKENLLDQAIDNKKLAEIDELRERYVEKKSQDHNDRSDNAQKAFRKNFYYRLNEYLASKHHIRAKGLKTAQQMITNRVFDEIRDWIRETMLGSSYKKLDDYWEEEE